MTQFEFITVAISIVMALGVSRLLDGIGPSLRSDRRSWIHVGWLVQKFFNHILWWWSLWLLRETPWNLGLFAYELVGPVVLYLQATALVTPSESSPSWEARFFEIRPLFFVGNFVLVAISASAPIFFELGQNFAFLPLLFLGGLAVAGMVTRSVRVHSIIVTLALATQLVGLGAAVFITQPS